MRIVVTGGAGFIGRQVVRGLSGGHDVLTVDVRRAPGPTLVADIRDRAAVTAALGGADAVVHLAAKVGLGVDVHDMDDYVSSNTLGTAVLLRAMAAAGVHRLVQASSMVVYGEGRYDCRTHGAVRPLPRAADDLEAGRFEPGCTVCGTDLVPALVGEDAPLDPRNTYAATKVGQEHLAAVWARETSSRAVSLRLHNVYGPGMPRSTPYAGVAALFADALAKGEAPRVYEDGRQRRDFVHVADVARAVALAVEASGDPAGAGEHRAYNVGSGRVRTVGDLARALSAVQGGPEPVVTGQFRLGDVRHVTASSERIAAELGFRASVSLEDGVRDLSDAQRA